MMKPIPEGVEFQIDGTMPTMEQLHRIMPRCDLATWHRLLVSAMSRWHIVTPARQAAWIANVAVESNECRTLEEGLYYKSPAEGGKHALSKLFRSHFKDEAEAVPFYRNPKGLAQRVYGHLPGDPSVTYHGRGGIQVSLESNYRACGYALGLPLLEHPELLLVPEHATASAGWYWDSRGLNQMADQLTGEGEMVQFRALVRRINAGLIGMPERVSAYRNGRTTLG